MIELFVEKQRIDINESFSTLLTMSIDDIRDFGAKNTTFSKTIIIPGTKNNNKVFGNIFDVNVRNDYDPAATNIGNNFNAAVAANAMIFADNMQVFKGVFRILEIIVEDGFIEYECAVFGELGGFISALANKKIEELDFSAYNTAWNYTNITNSWNTIAGSGVYFPLIDYGAASSNKVDFNFDTFRPALYVREMLEKIISGSGYTWDFPLLTSALFNRMVIPNNQKDLTNLSSLLFKSTFTAATYSNPTYIPMTIITAGGFTGTNPITYTPAATQTINITCRPFGNINSLTGVPGTITFYLKKNGAVLTQSSRYVPAVPYYVNFNLDATGVTLAQNDILSVEVSSNITSYQSQGGQFQVDSSVATDVPVAYNDTIQINNCIPKGIFQRDFISDIVKMFNLYIFEDYETEKKLKILPFVTFYEDATSVDWSLKVDRSRPMRIKPMSELNSRYYHFKFKSDNDFFNENYRKKYNEGYGDFIYDTEYDFAKETKNIEVMFAGSVLTNYTGTDKIFASIFKLSNSNKSEDRMDSVVRIMQAKKITGATSWKIKNGNTNLVTLTSYGYAGHLDDPATPTFDLNFAVPKEINFSVGAYTANNLFNSYWSAYMAEITDKDSRMLMCTMKLAFKDIYKLDFSKLIWIDGGLYRLNKITDFNATNEDLCSVELLKIINRIY
jgi:hypothetical protein